jgi:hypothetical protein
LHEKSIKAFGLFEIFINLNNALLT